MQRRPTPPKPPAGFNLQNAINAGLSVSIPAGTWGVPQHGSDEWDIILRAGLTLTGPGQTAVAKALGGTDLIRLMRGCLMNGLHLADFALDGNAAVAQVVSAGEQRHCLFLNDCDDAVLERLFLTQPLGDGIFLWGGCERAKVIGVRAVAGITKNPRVGVNVQGANRSLVQACDVQGFLVAYKAELDDGDQNSVANQFVNCTCAACDLALGLNGNGPAHVTDYIVSGGSFKATGEYAMWFSRTARVSLTRGPDAKRMLISGGATGVFSSHCNTDLLISGVSFEGHSYCDVLLSNLEGLGPTNKVRITDCEFRPGARAQGCVFHTNPLVTQVEIDHCTYPKGQTLYNPANGAVANLHDNTAV